MEGGRSVEAGGRCAGGRVGARAGAAAKERSLAGRFTASLQQQPSNKETTNTTRRARGATTDNNEQNCRSRITGCRCRCRCCSSSPCSPWHTSEATTVPRWIMGPAQERGKGRAGQVRAGAGQAGSWTGRWSVGRPGRQVGGQAAEGGANSPSAAAPHTPCCGLQRHHLPMLYSHRMQQQHTEPRHSHGTATARRWTLRERRGKGR